MLWFLLPNVEISRCSYIVEMHLYSFEWFSILLSFSSIYSSKLQQTFLCWLNEWYFYLNCLTRIWWRHWLARNQVMAPSLLVKFRLLWWIRWRLQRWSYYIFLAISHMLLGSYLMIIIIVNKASRRMNNKGI